MAKFDTIKTAIDANINTNGNQAITGSVMNSVLKQMVDSTDAELTELESRIDVNNTLYDKDGQKVLLSEMTGSNGIYVNSNGKTDTGAAYAVTDYQYIKGIRTIEYNGRINDISVVPYVTFYDISKKFISGVFTDSKQQISVNVEIPETAYYIRVSCYKSATSFSVRIVNEISGAVLNAIGKTQEDVKVLESEISEANSKLLELESEISEANSKLLELESEISEANSKLPELESEVAVLEQSLIEGYTIESYDIEQANYEAYDGNKIFDSQQIIPLGSYITGVTIASTGNISGKNPRLYIVSPEDIIIQTIVLDKRVGVEDTTFDLSNYHIVAKRGYKYLIEASSYAYVGNSVSGRYYYLTSEGFLPLDKYRFGYAFSYKQAETITQNLQNQINEVKSEIGWNEQVFSVKKEGGDFNNLNDALAYLRDRTGCEIHIYEGEYIVSDKWTDEQISKAVYDADNINSWCGEVLKDVTIVGIGDREKIVIKADLATNNNQIALFNLFGNVTIKNVTMYSRNCRYTIHDDFSKYNKDCTHNFIDCIILDDNEIKSYKASFGAGIPSGSAINFENCILNKFLMHSNNSFENSAYLNIKNCTIMGGMELTDYASGKAVYLNVENSSIGYITYSQNYSHDQYFRLKMHGCPLIPIHGTITKYETDGVAYKSNSSSSSIIAKGTLLKRSGIDYVAPFSADDNYKFFYGVAMEEMPIKPTSLGYMATNFKPVICHGYIPTSLVGISEGFEVGSTIGIVNGVMAVTDTNVVGIVDYIISSIGYIRLVA